jgi:hypothetical protein
MFYRSALQPNGQISASLSIQESSFETSLAPDPDPPGVLRAFKDSIRLFLKKDMMLLSVVFFYTGVEGCFIWVVYATAIGFTGLFGLDADRLVGLCGILIGIGEIIGGGLFSILASGSCKCGKFQHGKTNR